MAVTYTPTTNFGAKDSLPQNDPDKVIKGSEFSVEFTAIQTAFGLAASAESPTFTGTVTIPTADINGGAIDGTTIGGTTPAAASFTTVSATGNITVGGTVDGRDVAADGTKLDGIEAGADVTDTTNVTAAGALMDSELTDIAAVKALNQGVATTDSPSFAGLTATGSVSLAGASTTADITFGDNDKAIFGAGSDLSIYHDGSNSYISESGTGNLIIGAGAGVLIKNKDLDENLLSAYQNGAVELFYDNTEKLATTATGIDVSGTVTADGLTVDGSATIQASSSPALIVKDTTNNAEARLQAFNSTATVGTQSNHSFSIETNDTNRALFASDGDISFYEDTGTTAQLVWDASEDALTFGDSVKATFGAGSDLQIYHDASDSVILDNGTGNLKIQANDLVLKNADGSKEYLKGTDGGSVRIRYNNTTVLETTSTGIDVTGTVTADGLTVDGNGDVDVTRNAAAATDNMELLSLNAEYSAATTNGSFGGYLAFKHRTGGNVLVEGANIGVIGEGANTADLYIRTAVAPLSGAPVNRIKVDNNGDISFYEDTGTTPKFFWDASAESLGIGTTSPSRKLHVDASGVTALFGNTEADNSIELTRTTSSASYVSLAANSSAAGIVAGPTFTFSTSNSGGGAITERMRITSAGNVGIGVSSLVTGSTRRVLQVSTGSDGGQLALADSTTEAANPRIFATNKSDLKLSSANSGSSTIQFITGTAPAERMRIDSSGNVGIGTSSPSQPLHVDATGSTTAALFDNNGTNGDVVRVGKNGTDILKIRAEGTADVALDANGGAFIFKEGGSEAMRLDSSGNLLVGTTDSSIETSSSGEGVNILSNKISVARDGVTANFNRLSDGAIVQFRKDGTTVGSIGTASSGDLYIADGRDAGLKLDGGNNQILPVTSAGAQLDNALDLGKADTRFKDLYLSGNVTSSGTFRGGAGSAATPTFLTDGSTGMFRASSNDIGFSCAGSEAMRIDSAGNVGIGTSSPSSVLHAVGSTGIILGAATGDNWQTAAIKPIDEGAQYKGTLAFYTHALAGSAGSPTERMRIDSSGNLLVGTTSTSGKVTIANGGADGVYVDGTGTGYVYRTSNASGLAGYFVTSSGAAGSISVSGTTTTYNTSSDQRLKDNIVDAPSASDDIDAIQVRSFDWKVDGSHQKYGMVAQELQSVAPEAVTGDPESDDMMGVDYSKLVPMLVKEIQSLRARVAQLEGA